MAKTPTKRKAKKAVAKTFHSKKNLATVSVKEVVTVRQIENVRAKEVDQVIQDERDTANVISAVKIDEGDGEYTVVFTYQR
jgi:hypothetical protein